MKILAGPEINLSAEDKRRAKPFKLPMRFGRSPESCHLGAQLAWREQTVAFDFALKREFCSGLEATATFGSPNAQKPLVSPCPNLAVTSLSPTLAARETKAIVAHSRSLLAMRPQCFPCE